MPMKRSRDLTMQAAISENVEKIAEPSITAKQHAGDGPPLESQIDAHQKRDQVHQDGLKETSRTVEERARPLTSAERGAGLTMNFWRIPRSRSQISEMP